MIELLNNEAIYQKFVQNEIAKSEKYLWVGTADIKDLYVQRGKRFAPFLAVLSDLVKRGVEVRLLHAKEPGPRFRRDFDRYPALIESERFERALCPRVHFKILIVDGKLAFIGSANLTGAGLGAKHRDKRNFESGILTDEPRLVREAMEQFDSVFMGARCAACRLRRICPDPIA